jgi:putative N6-adenine-specific DNA methylase
VAGEKALDTFAVTAPGLEPIVAAELRDLGIAGTAVNGGVEWRGDLTALYSANLHLRAASRVVVRVTRFRARSFIELERHLKRLDWGSFLGPERRVALRVTSTKSRLYHERAIAERFARWLTEGVGCAVVGGVPDDERPDGDGVASKDAGDPVDRRAATGLGEGHDVEDQLLIVRFHRDECVVSVDASGALLHRRGYRRAIGKAPLRETLGAAMLLASGWTPTKPLLDPFCGSGTIVIEGVLIARKIAPGLASQGWKPRSYAFEQWPMFDGTAWRAVVDRARGRIESSAPSPIRGADRDAGAIEASLGNALRAGVEHDAVFETSPISSLGAPPGTGWMVTNPPYGVRIGDRERLRNLYAALGRLARDRYAGWKLAMLSADPMLAGQVGLDWREALRTTNGGVPVKLIVAEVSPHATPSPVAP